MVRKEELFGNPNKILMKNGLKRVLLLIGSTALMSVCALSISSNAAFNTTIKVPPRYLLNGALVGSSGIYDLYDIGNNEVAVALNKDHKNDHLASFDLTSITIPSGKTLTGIYRSAFMNNPTTKVVLPSTITVIDYEAFMHSGITSITIPASIDQIGDAAFYNCDDLTEVTFTNSDQESGGSALSCECDEDIGGGDQGGEGEGGEGEGGEGGQTPTIHFCELELIPSYCFFKCSNLEKLSLPSSIKEIGEEAFNGCSSLNSAIFFQNIETIRNGAFQGCTSLRNIYISRTMFDPLSTGAGIEPHAFNFCHEQLDIRFCGARTDVETWVTNHPTWGWKNNLSPDFSVNKYGYTLVEGDTYFSNEWQYTCNNGEVTITKYTGDTPTEGFLSVPDRMVSPAGNRVTRIKVDAFSDEVKASLERLYLPTTLTAIDNLMFRTNYPNLYIVDVNTACKTDENDDDPKGRINLSGMNDLEFIGHRAFSGIGGTVANQKIELLHLPARVRAIGDEAFGIYQQRMLPKVKQFLWDYNDNDPDNASNPGSRLETVGSDTFYGLGISEGAGRDIVANGKHQDHTPSTIIFPRTFKHFGMTDDDYAHYKNDYDFDFKNIPNSEKATKTDRPAHAFAGCSLLGKVVFKGSDDPDKTTDLVIPLQTFVYNESLQTIVFEERNNHMIVFHTQYSSNGNKNYHYPQESIGSNAGHGKNDFYGEPFLQTLVLPNKTTKLHIQNFAFHGNSRAAIYLSGTFGTNMYRDTADGWWRNMDFNENDFLDASGNETTPQWRTIGDEVYYNGTYNAKGNNAYYGYCFVGDATKKATNESSLNTFNLDQRIPIYDNVHFTLKENNKTIAEVGGGTGSKEYAEKDYCSFVCETTGTGENIKHTATMTNYLFSLYDGRDEADIRTARVPETVSVNGQSYTVNKIGDSAFSACHCDGKDTPTDRPAGYPDLATVELPNAIESIGDYAFIRAYGVTKICSYTGENGTASEGMPSSLSYIGKNAFIFCGIKKIRKIPYTCVFYENKNEVYNIASVFANSVDLRYISFLGENGAESKASKYYETTQYTATTALDGTSTLTNALYSKDTADGNFQYNMDRLLLVLNRSKNDYKKPTIVAGQSDPTDAKVTSDTNGIEFDGTYKSNPHLFGAYKMGLWIRELKCGTPTKDGEDSGTTYIQPLFSPVGKKNNATTQDLTVEKLYLGSGSTPYDNDALKCNLRKISGTNILNLSKYAFNGCEELINVVLPNVNNGSVPEGLFANVKNANTNYVTDSPRGSEAHVLDLTNTGYKTIGKEAFKNNTSIQTIIAPSVSNFTIGDSAFTGCSSLHTLDCSNVTGTLTINASAFNGCSNLDTISFGATTKLEIKNSAFKGTKASTITWPATCNTCIFDTSAFESCAQITSLDLRFVTTSLTIGSSAFKSNKIASILWPSSGTIKIENNGAFQSCTSLTSVSLPTNMTSTLGESTFNGCTNLESVNTVGGNTVAIQTIGKAAFYGCTKLDSFTFSKLTSLKNINESAFENAGELADPDDPDGYIRLSSNVTGIGKKGFSASKIDTIYIQSSSISLGEAAFYNCTSLKHVRFTNAGCSWNGYNKDVFSNCTSLVELQLPTGFIFSSNNGYGNNKLFIGSDSSIKIFMYLKYTTSASIASYWRQTSAGVRTDEYYFYVTSLSDLVNNGNPISTGTNKFWTRNETTGEAIILGTVTSNNGTTITFSSGATLTAGGFSY